jgi:hypothetical protein
MTASFDIYMFIICVDYLKALFHLPKFLRSPQNTNFDSLLKELNNKSIRNCGQTRKACNWELGLWHLASALLPKLHQSNGKCLQLSH